MHKAIVKMVGVAVLLVAFLTLGCGGGGGSSTAASTPPPSGTGTVSASVN